MVSTWCLHGPTWSLHGVYGPTWSYMAVMDLDVLDLDILDLDSFKSPDHVDTM